ncbi:TD and POZ domain-containing protein 3 [Trichonephila clavata]|uniref:TD and POZ domain-containing protein 3 n=1 Tax=Trichonephila clavata TaxID=2740835 RepID=A0A8X6KZV4_TRICU|nr:TD and POZ domain-containing protein 3 [Trichonephila clavata]
MDYDDFSENKCFTFTWKIENYSYSWQENGECISSPVFVVNTIGNSKWKLEIYPKGVNEAFQDFVSIFLIREVEDREICISFDVSFLATDDSVLVRDIFVEKSFPYFADYGVNELVKHDEVLKTRRKDYLPGNVLTVRCRMWHNNEETNCGHCFARTRIAVERRSFVWNIKQFGSFQESIYTIPSTSTDQPMMKLKLFPSCVKNCKTFILEVSGHYQMLKFTTFRLYLVDSSGGRTECHNDEIALGKCTKNALFTLTFSKEELMEKKNRYIPNDILQLYCECNIASGIILEEIENIAFWCPPSIQKGNLSSDELESKNMLLESTKILLENLESLHKENLLCDTKLKTKTGTFPAHKNILSARSPVFKPMFTNDMRERNSECVNIEDLDDDTVQRMLLYMYTATVPDLQWDSACNLYAAADKYEILSLKISCRFNAFVVEKINAIFKPFKSEIP